jgi:hypothetical protein
LSPKNRRLTEETNKKMSLDRKVAEKNVSGRDSNLNSSRKVKDQNRSAATTARTNPVKSTG